MYIPGYIHPVQPRVHLRRYHAQRTRHDAQGGGDGLTALAGGVTEQTVSDDGFTVQHRFTVGFTLYPFHCWARVVTTIGLYPRERGGMLRRQGVPLPIRSLINMEKKEVHSAQHSLQP